MAGGVDRPRPQLPVTARRHLNRYFLTCNKEVLTNGP
jgi:hypothetical protein